MEPPAASTNELPEELTREQGTLPVALEPPALSALQRPKFQIKTRARLIGHRRCRSAANWTNVPQHVRLIPIK